MIITSKALLITGAVLIAGVATVSASTINQPAKLPATVSTIPVATGNTPAFPNVSPQIASGGLQGSNYSVQTTAIGTDQYNGGNITKVAGLTVQQYGTGINNSQQLLAAIHSIQ